MVGRWPLGAARRVLLLGSSLLLAGCALLPRSQPPPTVTLKVVSTPQLSSGPFFIASEEGYFAEQGLQVEFVRLTSSREGIPALAKGDIDVLAGGINVALLNAMAHDSGLSIVADKAHHAAEGCPNSAVMARKELIDSGAVKSAADMRGKRVAFDRGGSGEFHMQRLLAQGGLTVDDVTVAEVPDTAIALALADGSVDFALISEPAITRALDTGKVVLFWATRDVVPEYPIGVLTFGPNLNRKHPEVGERFMVAYLKGVRQYNQGKTDRNLEIVSRNTELDREFLLRSCWPVIRGDGAVHLQSELDFQAWAMKQGLLDEPASAENLWNPRFVDYANKQLGPP